MNHPKSGPFENWTKIDFQKSGHVQISDPHCNKKGEKKVSQKGETEGKQQSKGMNRNRRGRSNKQKQKERKE